MSQEFPLVAITWLDHCSSDDLLDSVEEAIKVCDLTTVHSCAYLIFEDPQSYLICMNLAPQNFSNTMRILKSTVIKFRKIDDETATVE